MSPLQWLAEILYKHPLAGPLQHSLEAHLQLLCRFRQMNWGPLWKSRSISALLPSSGTTDKTQSFTRKMWNTYHLLLEVSTSLSTLSVESVRSIPANSQQKYIKEAKPSTNQIGFIRIFLLVFLAWEDKTLLHIRSFLCTVLLKYWMCSRIMLCVGVI